MPTKISGGGINTVQSNLQKHTKGVCKQVRDATVTAAAITRDHNSVYDDYGYYLPVVERHGIIT